MARHRRHSELRPPRGDASPRDVKKGATIVWWDGGISVADYERAEAQLRATEGRFGFTIHAAIYAVVNVALLVLNLVLLPSFLWFLFSLVGWGLGLAVHYLFAVRFLGRQTGLWQARVERRARGLRAPVVNAD